MVFLTTSKTFSQKGGGGGAPPSLARSLVLTCISILNSGVVIHLFFSLLSVLSTLSCSSCSSSSICYLPSGAFKRAKSLYVSSLFDMEFREYHCFLLKNLTKVTKLMDLADRIWSGFTVLEFFHHASSILASLFQPQEKKGKKS